MKASRFLITAFVTFILASCIPATPDTMTAEAMNTNPVTYQAEQIKSIDMSHADMRYLSLFASREEDQPSISKFAQALTKLMSKAKPYVNTMDSWQHFFTTGFGVNFKDGTSMSLTLDGKDGVFIQDGKEEYYAEDAGVVTELNKLLKSPEQTQFSTLQPRIGETVRLTGSDAYGEQGQIRLYVYPYSVGSTGGYRTVKGEDFPTRRALRIYIGATSRGRYDLSFPMPAYGEAIDGSLQPITPGKWYILYDTGSLQSSRVVEIKAPLKPLLSINGLPVTDKTMQPVVRDGRMLLPLRSLASAFGWKVTYLQDRNQVHISTSPSLSTTAVTNSEEVESESGIWIDGKPIIAPEAQPIVLNNTTYLPLRATADAFHFDITWSKELRSVHLKYQPELLPLDGYKEDSPEYKIASVVNEYVVALNSRDSQKLKLLFSEKDYFWPPFENIGHRQITAIRDISFQSRFEGKFYVAYVTFNYLFSANGDNLGSAGIVLTNKDGKWLITDVD